MMATYSVYNGAAYNGYNPNHYSDRVIVTYTITLLGRHRYIKVPFLYNRRTHTTISTKKGNNLQDLLRKKFGSDAIAVLVDGEPWYDEEDLLRAEMLPERGGRYYVLYNDNSPSYSEALDLPPALDVPSTALPTFEQLESGTARATHEDGRREERIHGYTYYPSIPSFTRSIVLRTSDGRSKPLVMNNLDADHVDQLIHFLSYNAGDRWIGVQVGDEEFVDDSIMFSKDVREGGVYCVTYKMPGKLNLLGRAKEKKREVVYSTSSQRDP